jgi:sugar lactone lactonase YvrE
MIRKPLVVVLAALFFTLLIAPAVAQDTAAPPGTVIAEGLTFPRGIAYDEEGNLYVAEAGSGGDVLLFEQEGVQITGGLTSQVTKIAPDGTKTVAVPGLASVFNPNEGGVSLGVYRAIPAGDSLWLVLSDAQNLTVFSDAVLEIDIETKRVKNYIDMYAYEVANNPDGTEEVYSNPSDVAVGPDGTVYIVDTGANTLYTWSDADGLQPVQSWPNTVPTSVDFGPDGSIYVGFLGTGLVPGAATIEHWSADGSELIETFTGLTTVSDILVTEAGDLYATQLVFLGEEGPGPGSVVQVTADGFTSIAEGLAAPFGLALSPDGNLVVSTGSAFGPPGTGTILELPLG